MPQKLHSVYVRSWDSIQALDEPDRSRAIDTLRWLTFGYWPLIVQELAEALVVSLDSDAIAFTDEDLPTEIDDDSIDGEIKNLCGSLIELRHDSQGSESNFRMVRLVHASVKEFLMERLPVPTLVGSVVTKCPSSAAHHAELAARCIRFLDCPSAWSGIRDEGERRSFTLYAADSWFLHLRQSEDYHDAISPIVIDFMMTNNGNFDEWKAMYESKASTTENRSPATSFYYACLFGLIMVIDYLYQSEIVDINFTGGLYGTSLQAVCVTGDMEAFNRLMLWNADTSTRGGGPWPCLGGCRLLWPSRYSSKTP